MKKLIVGNWKMNLSPTDVKGFLRQFPRLLKKGMEKSVVICPPAYYLHNVITVLERARMAVGGQNCHWIESGAYTGENSPLTLKQLGASYCLVGHSERRQHFGETIEVTAKKTVALQKLGIIPILCVGENKDERANGKTNDILIYQLEKVLYELDSERPLVIAYEPVWAIGSGVVAKPEMIENAHKVIRDRLIKRRMKDIPILYGGSVTPTNARSLMECKNVDGLLVGGASLDPKNFAVICIQTLNA